MEFKGSTNAEVYVISYKATKDDIDKGLPLSGPRGDYLCSIIGSFGKLADTRFSCWEEQGARSVANDIVSCMPKVIVGLGGDLSKLLINTTRPIFDINGSVYDIYIHGKKFKYVPLIDPNYVINRINDKDLTLKFARGVNTAIKIANDEYVDIYKTKNILFAHSYDGFVNMYDMYFNKDTILAYDIETNARPSMTADSKIIGFSVGNKKTGVYVSLNSAEWNISKDEETKIIDFMKNTVFKEKRLIIHNTMYERPYTYCCWDYEIPFEQAEDTLVMARMLRGAGEGAGLKYQAQKYLDYPDWETDLTMYIDGFKLAVNRIGLGPKKFDKLREELYSIRDIFALKDTTSFDELKDEDKEEILDIISKMKSPCIELYTEEELSIVSKCIAEKLILVIDNGGIKDSTIPYNYIPDKVLCKYGAMDSVSTFELHDFFNSIMDRDSTNEVDLHKGYHNWLEHMYVAYIMERNGAYWNEELVCKDEKFLEEQAIECLRKCIESPLYFNKYKYRCEYKYRPMLLSDYMPNIANEQGYSVLYNKDTKKYSIKKDGKVAALSKINDIVIPDNKKYYDLVEKFFLEDLHNFTTFDELCTLYNPMASKENDVPLSILMTEDVQMGGRINELNKIVESFDYDKIKETLNYMEQKFLTIAHLLCSEKELKEKFGSEWARKRKELYNGFCLLYDGNRKGITNKDIKSILNNKTPVVIPKTDKGDIKLDDDAMIMLYNCFIVNGIDQDDKTTWSPEFEWLMNFRLCKKSRKLLNTYINGNVGRKSVYVVDKDSMKNGEHCVKRLDDYRRSISNSEDYLLATKWSPNTAETGRWKSAQHTVPSDSPVKKYYSSRFKGGITLCPDYSTMEVRTLGGLAQDENMLNVFREGKDFHTETAKKIFKKDEVSPVERKFSKGATFSILYGSSENSFAKKYCKGDTEYAHNIFEEFYSAYPNVKKWVEDRHNEVKKDKRVSLPLSNRFIPIIQTEAGPGGEAAICRKAQNYPVQAQSADLTGCVVFDLQKYIEEHNMKSLVFMYVHDSIEVDVYPFEMLEFINHMKWLLNDAPMRRMGLPSKADVTLGKSLGHEIELSELECNEDFTEGTLTLEGYQDEIYETIDVWKSVYKTVEVSDEEWSEKFISMSDLFSPKKPYNPNFGTLRHKGKCVVHIKYY